MNIPENASKEQLDQLRKIWKEHGHYNTKETMITEKNTAKTIINDKIEMTNEVRVDIELPKENGDTPGLLIRKETKQYEYQAKDEITYKVTVKNQKRKSKDSLFCDSGYILCKCDGYEVTGYKKSMVLIRRITYYRQKIMDLF